MTSQKAVVKKIETIAEDTLGVFIEKPEGFFFKAGQYVVFDMPEKEHKDERPSFRSLSIASAPHEECLLFVCRDGQSAFKKNFFSLQEGETVTLTGPLGEFVLPEDKNVTVVFLVGGIGITPVRSMLLEEEKEKSGRCMSLFYSNRTPELAAFHGEMANLKLKNYTCMNTMTHLDEKDAWKGNRGFICAPLVSTHCKDVEGALYFIVGTKGFIGAMKEMLSGCGVDEKDIRVDNFGTY